MTVEQNVPPKMATPGAVFALGRRQAPEQRAPESLTAREFALLAALKQAAAALRQCGHIPGVTEQAICAADTAMAQASWEARHDS